MKLIMSESESESSRNRPRYFYPDKRVPSEIVTEKLMPFDEIDYLNALASFASSNHHPDGCTRKEAIMEYVDRGMASFVSRVLVPILSHKENLTQVDIANIKPSKIIKKLYKFGCPKMYYFHKTAVETVKYGINFEPVIPNPLAHDSVWLAAEPHVATSYLRNDQSPFLMVFPMELIMSILESQSDGENLNGDHFGYPVRVNFADCNDEEILLITKKMQIRSIDMKKIENYRDLELKRSL